MPLTYAPKIYLVFKLPDGTTHSDFFRPNQRLGDIVSALMTGKSKLGVNKLGRKSLDLEKSIGQLGLKHDDVITIS